MTLKSEVTPVFDPPDHSRPKETPKNRINGTNIMYAKLTPNEIKALSGASLILTEKVLGKSTGVIRIENTLAKEQFGIFENNQDYLEALSLLLSSTDETCHRQAFLKKIMSENVNNHDSVLEVGVGNGEITPFVCEKFKQATLIDINKRALDTIKVEESYQWLRVKKIHDSILNVKLKCNMFDAAVISHVLYYLDRELWGKCFTNIHNSLRENGALVVVLSGGFDKSLLANSFGGTPCDIDLPLDILSSCFPKNSSIVVYDISEMCQVNSLKEALCVASIYLNDAGASAKREELIDHINRFNKVNGGYRFEFTQRFIVLQK